MKTFSVRADRPVDDVIVDVLRALDEAARDVGVLYFVAGAMARDIVLRHVLGFETSRATRDIDLAVHVSDWEQFAALRERLVASRRFSTRGDAAQRVYYESGFPVDLVPFGGVVHDDGMLRWPPDRAIVMNVTGYAESLAGALSVELAPGTVVPVASLPALAMLKAFAWLDRGGRDRKDAQDLALLFRKYADTIDSSELHAADADILLDVDYDFERASPRLLGRHIRKLALPETVSNLLRNLGEDSIRRGMAIDMARDMTHLDDPVATADQQLRDFIAGLS